MIDRRSVSINADLTIDIDRESFAVLGEGKNMVVEFATTMGAWRVWRRLRGSVLKQARVATLSSEVHRLGLTFTIRTPKRRLITIGSTNGSWLPRLFGLKHISLHLG